MSENRRVFAGENARIGGAGCRDALSREMIAFDVDLWQKEHYFNSFNLFNLFNLFNPYPFNRKYSLVKMVKEVKIVLRLSCKKLLKNNSLPLQHSYTLSTD